MNKISKLFQPLSVLPKNAIVKNNDITSKSQKLMLDLGLIKSSSNGTFHVLPLGQKSIEKCIKLIDFYMKKVDAQKITIPHLTPVDLWKKSGRFGNATTELLTTKDRHEKLQILSPTHEESVTALLASLPPLSYKQFPLRLYQIGYKFRDELKPRFGLMRAREFLMKDCYSFDIDPSSAKSSYNDMVNIYKKFFQTIGVPFVDVQADNGTIGGSLSHEFHFPSDVGEDILINCKNCGYSSNIEVIKSADDDDSTEECPQCKHKDLSQSRGIEVAHTFLLDDKYSKLIGANYLQSNGKPQTLLMGSYGIGVTRLIAAAIETLSTEHEIRWPFLLAPFTACIIPPKSGSKEEGAVQNFTHQIYGQLNKLTGLTDSVIIDDRTHMTIGKRLLEAKRMGYPIIIVIGPKAANKLFEYHIVNDNIYLELDESELIAKTVEILKQHQIE